MNIQEMFIRVYQIRVICINISSGHELLKLHCKHLAAAAYEVSERERERISIGDGRSSRRIVRLVILGLSDAHWAGGWCQHQRRYTYSLHGAEYFLRS